MSRTLIAVEGSLKPGRIIELAEQPALPPGPVHVFLQPAGPSAEPPREDLLTVLESIWAGQRARGHKPPTCAEVDAEINALRDESEERAREIEAIQDRAARERQAGKC